MPRSRLGIRTREAFGSTKAFSGLFIQPVALPSAAFVAGPTIFNRLKFVFTAGLVSASVFGNPQMNPGLVGVSPTGIASGQAVGISVALRTAVRITGIGTAQALGSAALLRGPKITSLDYTLADIDGNQTITATGVDLDNVYVAYIGGTACAVSNITSTSVSITTPAKAAGTYSLQVRSPYGYSNSISVEFWSYMQLPSLEFAFDPRKFLVLGSGTQINSWKERVTNRAFTPTYDSNNPDVVANAFGLGIPGVSLQDGSLGATPAVFASLTRSLRFIAKWKQTSSFGDYPTAGGYGTVVDGTLRYYTAPNLPGGGVLLGHRIGANVGTGGIGLTGTGLLAVTSYPADYTDHTETVNPIHDTGTVKPRIYAVNRTASGTTVKKNGTTYATQKMASYSYGLAQRVYNPGSTPSNGADRWNNIGSGSSESRCETPPAPSDAYPNTQSTSLGLPANQFTLGLLLQCSVAISQPNEDKLFAWSQITFGVE